ANGLDVDYTRYCSPLLDRSFRTYGDHFRNHWGSIRGDRNSDKYDRKWNGDRTFDCIKCYCLVSLFDAVCSEKRVAFSTDAPSQKSCEHRRATTYGNDISVDRGTIGKEGSNLY